MKLFLNRLVGVLGALLVVVLGPALLTSMYYWVFLHEDNLFVKILAFVIFYIPIGLLAFVGILVFVFYLIIEPIIIARKKRAQKKATTQTKQHQGGHSK